MLNTLRQRLLVSVLLLGTIVALGDEPKPKSDHAFCLGLQCTEGRRVRSEVRVPDQGDSEIPVYAGSCPRGLPVDGTLKTLPRGHAFVGRDKKQVIIDLKDPERDLKDGDILLSSYETGARAGAAANFFDGSGHAALIGTVNGKKFHMDSPYIMSGRCSDPSFRSWGWTVLRLREYPSGVNTAADLEKMRKEHPEKIEQWQKYRADVLKRVNQYFEAMRRSPYEYNSNYLETKVFDKKTRDTWRTQIFPKEGKVQCPVDSVYCSELPATGFALADEEIAGRLPRGLSILTAINAFEGMTLKEELKGAKIESKEARTAFDRAWKKLINDVGGEHEHLMAEFRLHESKIREGTYQLLKLPREMRPTAFALLSSQVPMPISPTDLYNDVFRENGLLSYVGTYIGDGCYPVEKIVALGLPKAGEARKVDAPRALAQSESVVVRDPLLGNGPGQHRPQPAPQNLGELPPINLPRRENERSPMPEPRDPLLGFPPVGRRPLPLFEWERDGQMPQRALGEHGDRAERAPEERGRPRVSEDEANGYKDFMKVMEIGEKELQKKPRLK